MNVKSIRFRLTLWYSLAFFIGTALMFLVFYLVTKQTLLLQTDQELTVHANALVKIIANGQSNMMTGMFSKVVIAQQFSEMPGMLVAVADVSGTITASSQIGAESDPVIRDLFQKSSMLVKPIFVDRRIGSTILRIGVFPIMNNGNRAGLVLMGDPVEAIYQSLNILLVSLFIINLLFFIPALIGGHLLARQAMEPVSKISKKLAKITSDNLSERVDVPKTHDELEELATTFNSLFDRIAQAFTRERQFIGDVAHELKTPVSTLRSGIELALSKNRTNAEYKQIFSDTLIDVNRLSVTTKNILDLAWLGAENAHSIERHFDLSMVVFELNDIAVKLAAQKHVVIKSDIESNVCTLGIEDKIGRALLNIIDNAIKFTPRDKSITISLHKTEHEAVIKIQDTGIGIPKKELPFVFERFYRGSKVSKTVGSGLGLSISQGIIQAHGGDIKIISAVNKGTSVIILLPIASALRSS